VVATLSVLKFDDPRGADRVLRALQDLQEQQLITLEDSAIVSWPRGRKTPIIPGHPHQMARLGALGGAFWGFLLGMIFFVPLLGAAIGAGTGALAGSPLDGVIDEDFIRQVAENVTEGTSALFVLTSGVTEPDKLFAELKEYDFEIIWTNLAEESLQQLREVFPR
jgi:uncharacterized membrane protein